MKKIIVVAGATGHQGGSVVRGLLEQSAFDAHDTVIYAVSRDPASPKAQTLTALSPAIKILQGDLSAPAAILKGLPAKPWAIYIMSNPNKTEYTDATALIDAAIKAGAQRIVYSSVDRGYSSADGYNRPSKVQHWQSKHEVEAYLRKRVAENKACTYTIIRPVFFLDNFTPNFFGKLTATLWKDYITNRTLKLIDTIDIGKFAACALLDHSDPRFTNTEVNLAGDELTFGQANDIFKKKTGQDLPTTWKWLTGLVLWLAKDFKLMTDFLVAEGYAAPLGSKDVPFHMTTFEEWVDESILAKTLAKKQS
jgi:uncharacterized protein YbjT (DUF2867 family)